MQTKVFPAKMIRLRTTKNKDSIIRPTLDAGGIAVLLLPLFRAILVKLTTTLAKEERKSKQRHKFKTQSEHNGFVS